MEYIQEEKEYFIETLNFILNEVSYNQKEKIKIIREKFSNIKNEHDLKDVQSMMEEFSQDKISTDSRTQVLDLIGEIENLLN